MNLIAKGRLQRHCPGRIYVIVLKMALQQAFGVGTGRAVMEASKVKEEYNEERKLGNVSYLLA